MILDYGGAWAVNLVLKKWLADVSPKPSKLAVYLTFEPN